MKPRKAPRRQVFVLTPEEKRAVACIVGAFVLGLGTMHYRSKNPRATPPPTAKEQAVAAKAKRASASPAGPRATPAPAAEDDE